MPKTEIDYVSFDGLLLVNERWKATNLHCPRCGRGGGHVWSLFSEAQQMLAKTAKCGNHELHLFICIGCLNTGRGWEGIRAIYDVQDRAKQIIQLAFGEDR